MSDPDHVDSPSPQAHGGGGLRAKKPQSLGPRSLFLIYLAPLAPLAKPIRSATRFESEGVLVVVVTVVVAKFAGGAAGGKSKLSCGSCR